MRSAYWLEDSLRRSGLGWGRAGISWGMVERDSSRAGRDEHGTSTGRYWNFGLGGIGAGLGATEAGLE